MKTKAETLALLQQHHETIMMLHNDNIGLYHIQLYLKLSRYVRVSRKDIADYIAGTLTVKQPHTDEEWNDW